MIRRLHAAEIPNVIPLLEAAYARKAPYEARLRRYFAIEPEGWLVAEDAGTPIGMVGTVLHGAVAYVGLMAVLPSYQGRGIARRLMDASLALAAARGAGLVMLDASEAGAPLYLRSGFVERGKSVDLVFVGEPGGAPVEQVEVNEVLALDRAQFGADRARTLRVFANAFAGRLVGVRRAGRVAAYALAQDAMIGPIVAEDDAAARDAIAAALTLPFAAQPHILAPEDAAPFLETQGFKAARALRHMRRGSPDVSYRIVGKASFAVG